MSDTRVLYKPYIIGGASTSFVVSAASAGYIGPGDLQAFFSWWGLRGYNATYTGPAVDIVDSTGANPVTLNILSGGNLDLATLDAYIVAHGSTVRIPQWYDQVSTRHFTQATLTAMPFLERNGFGTGLPWIRAIDTDIEGLVVASGATLAQPFCASTVVNKILQTQNLPWLTSNGSGNWALQMSNTTAGVNTLGIAAFDGSMVYVTASDSANHIISMKWQGATSLVNVDGGANQNVSIATTGISSDLHIIYGGGGAHTTVMSLGEFGIVASAWSDAGRAAMYSNQHTYWGI